MVPRFLRAVVVLGETLHSLTLDPNSVSADRRSLVVAQDSARNSAGRRRVTIYATGSISACLHQNLPFRPYLSGPTSLTPVDLYTTIETPPVFGAEDI